MNSSWNRFNKYLYKYWKLQATIILSGLVTVPLSLVNPYITKLVIDKAYGNKDLKLFLILAIIGASIFIFNGLINSLNGYLSQRISRKVHFALTKDLFQHLQSLPLSFFNERTTGEHIYRLSSDVNSVSNFVCDTIPQMFNLFPRLLFILVIVLYLNWRLALVAFLLVPISYIQPYLLGKWLKGTARKMIEKSQDIYIRLHEAFSHMRLVKALGKEVYEIKRFTETVSKSMDFEIKYARLLSISNFSSSVLNKVLSGIIAFYGGYQVIKGTMTLGSLTAVMIYVTQLIGLIESGSRFWETTMINSVSRQRLAEILDVKPEIQDKQGAIDFPILQGAIEFKNVSFGYKKDEFILKDITFSIEPAAKIALVGSSGCGKTTLVALILRLYDVKKGFISIDGLDIKEIKLNSLKEQLGIALQEPFLWNDSVGCNILYGAEDAQEEEMIKAAKIAEADNFITGFPQGYDTVIGENACNISEGQKQRIAIARAVIKRPKILILDEAMSSLDSETEDKIIDNIRREFKDFTIIIVSHRLSTAKKMDSVYFLESPSHMEIGSHEELLRRSPKYKELFASQVEKIPEREIIFKVK